jgi:hypothetical protein
MKQRMGMNMTRLKIVRNNRDERRQLLQAKLSTSLIDDINLMCKWSGNEKSYVIGELLRYALAMEPDFQAYKQSLPMSETSATKKEAGKEIATAAPMPLAK